MRVLRHLAFALAAVTAAAAEHGGDIRTSSHLGRQLMAHARALDESSNFDFVADYSIKFQGCHHVSQWNADAEDEDDVRIKTKRLVRFRLCPSDSCRSDRTAGCTSKYGDYVVDMSTFVQSYVYAIANEKTEICSEAATNCNTECNDGQDADCVQACYESYDVSYCLEDDSGSGFDASTYAACAGISLSDGGRRHLENVQYYIGPYCADQGGEVRFGLFTDDTCTSFVSSGASTFYTAMGYKLPYSSESLVSTRCMTCGTSDGNGGYQTKDVCTNIYGVSGKCETKMSVDYPNESACTYIEGIKIIRADGVIRTSTVRKSKAAAVCIGLFLTLGVLLAGYVYYLRTKLGRAKINLNASAHTLI